MCLLCRCITRDWLGLLPQHTLASQPLRRRSLLLSKRQCLQALLRPALQARNAGESAAAAAVLQAFCRGNSEGQSMLIATILPTGEEGATGAGAWRTLNGRPCFSAV